MQIKNTENSYGWVSAALHWVMGLMMIGLVVVGLLLTFESDLITDRRSIMGLHKSLGVLVLMLFAVRLLWRFTNIVPKLPEGTSSVKKGLAHLVHLGLYLSMLVMPLSGWAMSSASGYPVKFFGLFQLPALIEKNKELGGVLRDVHQYAGYALIALFVLHVGGALVHHFIYKDNILKRMLMIHKA